MSTAGASIALPIFMTGTTRPSAFAELYERHYEAVFRAALRVTGNPADAEDVLQTVFLRVLAGQRDVEDAALPQGRYRLEVGSPGIDRPLLSRRDFERFTGAEVDVRTNRPFAGSKRHKGVLRGVAGEDIKLDVSGHELSVPLTEIAKANLVFRF